MPQLDATTSVLNQLILSYWASPSTLPLQIHFPCAQSDDRRLFVQCGEVTVLDNSYNSFVRMLSNFRTVQQEVAAVDTGVVSRLFGFYKHYVAMSNSHLDTTGDPDQFRVMKSGNGIMELRIEKSGFALYLQDKSIADGVITVQATTVAELLTLGEQCLGWSAQQQPQFALS